MRALQKHHIVDVYVWVDDYLPKEVKPGVKSVLRDSELLTILTKRGSPYLRRSLYLAAAAAERCDPELKATFERKRTEGKRYKQATIVVSRRIITRVYAVWKRGTPYIPREEQQIA